MEQLSPRTRRGISGWKHFVEEFLALPPVGKMMLVECPQWSSAIEGTFQGVDNVTWALLLRPKPKLLRRMTHKATHNECIPQSADIIRMRLKDISSDCIMSEGHRYWTEHWPDCYEDTELVCLFAKHVLRLQMRYLLKSSLSSCLRTALRPLAVSDVRNMCCKSDIENANERLPAMLQIDLARPVPASILDDSWSRVIDCLTPFEQSLLGAVCLYFNAFQANGAAVGPNTDDILLRKTLSIVLDPSQSVNDVFCDVTAHVDEFDLGGTPVLFISALHLAARLGDVSMCEVLLKEGADVNANVYLLPGKRRVQEGLPTVAGLDMGAMKVLESDGNGMVTKWILESSHLSGSQSISSGKTLQPCSGITKQELARVQQRTSRVGLALRT